MKSILQVSNATFGGLLRGNFPQQEWRLSPYGSVSTKYAGCQANRTRWALQQWFVDGEGPCPLLDTKTHPMVWDEDELRGDLL